MNFASLFSGCGGFDQGYIKQGFIPRFAFDSDPNACQNYEANIDGHIRNVDLRKGIPDECVLRDIDVLIAGPPCQGFSTAGKRDLNDERNHLLTLTGELALKINPKVLVVENVPGVLAGDHARYWKEMDTMMRMGGYRTHTMRIQASDLGMAQLRKRVIFFAWRTGVEIDFTVPILPAGNLRTVLKDVRGQ